MNLKIKRIFASILDLALVYVFFLLFSMFANQVVITNVTDYSSLVTQSNEILVETGLYEEKDGECVLITTLINEKLDKFYETNRYYSQDGTTFSYDQAREKSGLFHENAAGEYVENVDASEEALKEFYDEELMTARISIANRDDYKNVQSSISFILTITAYICLILSVLVLYFVVPLIAKKGRTIGKLLFKLEVISDAEKDLGVIQLFMRFLALFAIEILPSLYFYGIPFIISFAMAMVQKNGKSVHDYLGFTRVIERRKPDEDEKENG